MRAKPIYCGECDPIDDRLKQQYSWAVIFDQALEPDDQNEICQWLLDNQIPGYSHDRGDPLGPSGEIMFEHQADALMCYLAFK